MSKSFDRNIPITLQNADDDAITLSAEYFAGRIPVNGALARINGAITEITQSIYITSAADDSDITFTIVGILNGANVSEVLTGTNGGTAISVNHYDFITSITTSAATSGNITIGSSAGRTDIALSQTVAGALSVSLNGNYKSGTLTIPNPCYLELTCTGDETSNTFTIVGLDVNGNEVTTTVAGVNATTATVSVAYQTVTSFTCSINTVNQIQLGVMTQTYSEWVRLDNARDLFCVSATALFSTGATATATLEYGWFQTPENPNSTLIGAIADSGMTGISASASLLITRPADAARLSLPSWTDGTVTFAIRQADSGHRSPY